MIALTARELQVAELVVAAHRNREIATLLNISEGTVKIHIKHIFTKRGITSRAELIRDGVKS